MTIDHERLLRLRVVVARVGEMDNARWWNTKGQLGKMGAAALRRGLPRTHHFAQARSVFAVATHRCAELFDPPGCMTLWNLPAELEDEFDSRWEGWLDRADTWRPFFEQVAAIQTTDLTGALKSAGLVTEADIEDLGRLRRSAEGRAVQIPGIHQPDDKLLTRLALAFARGEVGEPAIPYARLDG